MLCKCCTQLCQQIGKTQQWPQDWKRSVFFPIPKKGDTKEYSNYHTITLISHASKEGYAQNPSSQASAVHKLRASRYSKGRGLEKGRGIRDQITNSHWIIEKEREFQKNIYFCFIGYTKSFDCVDYNKLWKILKEMGVPDHFTYLLRNLYVNQKQQLEPDTEQWIGSKLGKKSSSRLYLVTLLI